MAFTKKIAGWVAGRIKGEQARKDTMRWMEKTGLGMVLDAAGDYALAQGALKGAGKLKGLLTGGGQAAAPVAAKALPEGVTEVGRMASASPAEARSLTAQMVQPKPMPALPAGTSSTTMAPRAAAPITPPTAPATMPRPITAAPQAAPMRAMVAPGAGTTTMAPRVAAGVTPPVAPATMPLNRQLMAQAPASAAPSPAMMRPSIPAPRTPDIFAAPSRTGVQAAMPQMAPPQPNLLQRTLGAVKSGASATMQYGRENAPLIAATAPAVANVIGAKIEQDIEQDKIKREQEARNRLAMLLMPMFQAQMGQAAPSFQPRG